MEYNKIYARVDYAGKVIEIFSEAFKQPSELDICIDDKNTDRHGAQKYKVTDDKGFYNYVIKDGKLVERDKTQDIANAYLAELRARREIECFPVINRGQLWYDTLTEEQLTELKDWYKAWLGVTRTKIVPVVPTWIK